LPSGEARPFRFALEVCRNPAGAVSRWKSVSGRKAAGCIPIYVPEEILHAAGMLAGTIWGTEISPAAAVAPGAPEYLLDRGEAFREWAGTVSGRVVSEGALERSVWVYNENRRVFALLEERMAETPGSFSGTELWAYARAGMALPREGHTEILNKALSRSRAVPGPMRAKVFLTGMLATGPVMEALDAAGGGGRWDGRAPRNTRTVR